MFYFHLAVIFLVVAVITRELCVAQAERNGHDLRHFNVTLAALNTTLPNANHTGAPLVLGQNGASTGISFHVTSTYASYPYDDYPTLALVNKTLRAYTTSGRWITNATDVSSGGTLGWVTTTIYAHPAPEVYSAVKVSAYEHPLLAVHGFHNLWSLCPFPGTYPQTNIVFNASDSSILAYDRAACYPVVITMIPCRNS